MTSTPSAIDPPGATAAQTTAGNSVSIPANLVGVVTLGAAFLGLCYNAISSSVVLSGALETPQHRQDLPYFYPAFYVMSGICVTCYIVLLICAVDFVMSRLRYLRLFALVLLFEVLYTFSIGGLWLDPTIGLSVAAATGIANGGMMLQFLCLLPIWGPLVLWWAKSRQHAASAT